MDAACDSMLTAAALTGEVRPLGDCVPALYAARLAPRGRLDQWYTTPPRPAWTVSGQRLSPADLAAGASSPRDAPWAAHRQADISVLRSMLVPGTLHLTAVTQGDATEPNLADPLCWLDFEYAGRNAIAGDAACLLWYLLGMGGSLVPAYRRPPTPAPCAARCPRPPSPAVDRLDLQDDRIELDYTWGAGPGRHAALTALRRRLRGDLGNVVAPDGDVTAALRPFLAARILGVIPLGRMSGPDALLCLARLAEALHPAATLDDLTHSTRVSSPAWVPTASEPSS